MQKSLLLLLGITFVFSGMSQTATTAKIWEKINESAIEQTGKRYTFPSKYSTLHLDKIAMRNFLSNAPMELAATAKLNHGLVFEMPMPDGSFQKFHIVDYYVLHPDLAAKYPEIKTYTGQGIDDPSAIIKIDMTPLGFHAMVLSPKGSFFIDPYCANTTTDYICYDKKDLQPATSFICKVTDELNEADVAKKMAGVKRSSGSQLRTYRLALAATGEYTATKGGTVAGAMAAIATSINRVNGVYEKELSIRMVVIANNNLLIYTNAATDPYTNDDGTAMLSQNATTINNVIGAANYDFGHVFSTGGGGIATLNGPCGTNRARGVTGSPNPVGDAYDIDYVAHEMGHQFGGNHTFNSQTGSCGGGTRNAGTAYEPGSGITVMAYAGICGTDDLDPHSIAFFHTISFDEITTFSQTGTGSSCGVLTSTGNTPPVVTTMGANMSIPISTPFTLTGAATDADNDVLTYSWEEFDLGAAGAWNVQSTAAPMFTSFTPTTSPARTFPKLSDIINNSTTIGELLPNQARTLKFRLTARDNRVGGGGVMHPDATLNISVVNNGGAFAVTAPNTAVSWAGNSSQTVTWNVNGTTNAPISTANVRISLSTDGGNSFPIEILASTLNDGTQIITVPNIATTLARIKIEAVGNIYFDISNTNFTITAAAVLSTISTGNIAPLAYCAGAAVNVPFTTDNAANGGNVFTAQLSNADGTFTAPAPVVIGSITATATGTIAATIPSQTLAGNAYRIRVVSSNPAVTGSVNNSNITVNRFPDAAVITSNGITTICSGSSVILSGNANAGTWSPGGSTAVSILVTASGDYFVTNTNNCGSVISNHIIVNVIPLPVVDAGTYTGITTGIPVIMLTGTPEGGNFSGPGVSGNGFMPDNVGVGTYVITYTYTNENGCIASDTTTIVVNPQGCNYTAGTITGPANACIYMGPGDGDASYSITSTGASGYNWVTPANATIVSGQGTNTIVVHYAANFVSGYLKVTVANGCGGASTLVALSVRTTLPVTPGTISGPTNACPYIGAPATYRIRKVANANSYIWTVPAGATINSHPGGSGVNDTVIVITYTNSFVSGTAITVKAASFCGASTSARSLAIAKTNPSVPGTISGPTDACPFAGTGTQATYTIPAQASAASYNWTVPNNAGIVSHPGGNGVNDTIIKVNFTGAYTTGMITVAAVNACSISAVRSLTVKTSLPLAPTKIYGDPTGPQGPQTIAATDACPYIFSGTNAVYSINKVAVATDLSGFASGYNWTVTDAVNAHIVSHPGGTGANDTIIVVHFDAAYTTGAVQVQSLRACGGSTVKSVTVKKNIPAKPDPIMGLVSVCPSSTQTYTVNAVNAASYNWTVPSTIVIISGQGTNTVQLQFLSNFNGGTIRVATSSVCGTSAAASLALTKCVAFARLNPAVSPMAISNTENRVFPNPSNGNFRILVNSVQKVSTAKIEIVNEFGQQVYLRNEKCMNGIIDVQLHNKLTNGIYFINCTMNGQKSVQKLMITK